jgi:hypothetical protein
LNRYLRSIRPTPGWLITILILAPALAVGGVLLAMHWPYRYAKIHPMLEDVFGNEVKIAHYHRTYFPHPGFMGRDITLTRKTAQSKTPLGTVQTLWVQGRWSDLLTLQKRVRLVEISGVHLVIPAPGSHPGSAQASPGGNGRSGGKQKSAAGKAAPSAASTGSKPAPQPAKNNGGAGFTGPSTAIDQLRIHNSVLDILRVNGGRYTFAIRELYITGMQKGRPMHYRVDMENPLPAGHIASRGIFGPVDPKDFGDTPVSGQFTFNQVKLRDVGDLRGILASSGHFKGPLRAINAEAIAEAPDFAVNHGRPTHITGYIHCIVNALNGDVVIPGVQVTSGHTTVRAHGQVAGSPKVARLAISLESGRAEDVLRVFIHDGSPIAGPADLQSEAYVGPPGKPFLQRLRVEGRFDVPAERVTDAHLEQRLSAFSLRARNQKAPKPKPGKPDAVPDALSSLHGPAVIRKGVISTPGIHFQVPGAEADLHGTFKLDTERVHLAGNLRMQADISHAATGIKSILLKPLAPFFKKRDRVTVFPIAVVGDPGHYRVTGNLGHNK